jgi:hypothetical protein
MKSKEKIFNGKHFKDEEVCDYLYQNDNKLPLPLLYLIKDGGLVTRDFIVSEKNKLVGILIDENTVVYLKALNKNVFMSLCGNVPIYDVTERDVQAWVKSQFTDTLNIGAATEKDIELLEKKRSDFLITLECLNFFQVEVPNLLRGYFGWIDKGARNIRHSHGEARIYYYLEHFGDLLVFSNYSENELVRAAVRHDFFQSAKQ